MPSSESAFLQMPTTRLRDCTPRRTRSSSRNRKQAQDLWKLLSALAEERLNLASQNGKLGLNDVPNQPVVYLGLAVDQDVSEGDDGAMLADPRSQLLI
jgi:hypothetical protein